MFGLRYLSEIGKLPAGLRNQLEAAGVIFTAGKVGISRHFSGYVPGVFSSSGVSRYREVLQQLPASTLRIPVEPVFVYRAAGVRPKSPGA